jgi:hypothetical protein
MDYQNSTPFSSYRVSHKRHKRLSVAIPLRRRRGYNASGVSGGREPLALGGGEIEAVPRWPPSGELPSREKGSTSIRPEQTIVRNDLTQDDQGVEGRPLLIGRAGRWRMDGPRWPRSRKTQIPGTEDSRGAIRDPRMRDLSRSMARSGGPNEAVGVVREAARGSDRQARRPVDRGLRFKEPANPGAP